VSEPKPPAWAQARFGHAAGDLARAISRAIYQAHEMALAAHVCGGLASNDTYGATLHVAQYEQLAAEAAGIPGVSIRKPKDIRGRFDLVVWESPPVVLYPWRYATDKALPRERARLRRPVSDLRKTLLSLNENTISGQLTLDQGARDSEELEAELAEMQTLLEQLAELGQVVTVGFASNPGGIFDLGWGEVELLDEQTGRVHWRYWEPLPPPGSQTIGGEPQRAVSPAAGDGYDRSGRFDHAAPEDDLGLKLRPHTPEPPISEPERPQEETGSDEA
jgi:hypothetical protein